MTHRTRSTAKSIELIGERAERLRSVADTYPDKTHIFRTRREMERYLRTNGREVPLINLRTDTGSMRYRVGDQVYASLGTLKVVGTVVDWNEGLRRYLVHFSAVQQDWYAEDELTPFDL